MNKKIFNNLKDNFNGNIFLDDTGTVTKEQKKAKIGVYHKKITGFSDSFIYASPAFLFFAFLFAIFTIKGAADQGEDLRLLAIGMSIGFILLYLAGLIALMIFEFLINKIIYFRAINVCYYFYDQRHYMISWNGSHFDLYFSENEKRPCLERAFEKKKNREIFYPWVRVENEEKAEILFKEEERMQTQMLNLLIVQEMKNK